MNKVDMRDGEKTNKVGSVSGCQKVVWNSFSHFSQQH